MTTFRAYDGDRIGNRLPPIVLDEHRRRQIHGPIQPMERPNLFRRMLGLH